MAEKGAITVREAGRRGGTQTRKKYGGDFYKPIGKKGGEITKQQHGPQFCEKTGRKGGQTMKKLVEQGKRAKGGAGSPGDQCGLGPSMFLVTRSTMLGASVALRSPQNPCLGDSLTSAQP